MEKLMSSKLTQPVVLKAQHWKDILNSLGVFKPDSMWKAIRNKQRLAYIDGLLKAYELTRRLENRDDILAAIEEEAIRIGYQYED
jgi:hypothetical protein